MDVTQPLKDVLYRLYESRLLAGIRRRPVPSHLGLIQDGHRRYARQAGLSNLEGYRLGADKAREVLTWCAELKVPMVSLWWLSTENLSRESADVAAVLRVTGRATWPPCAALHVRWLACGKAAPGD